MACASGRRFGLKGAYQTELLTDTRGRFPKADLEGSNEVPAGNHYSDEVGVTTF